jgi:SAM-dependent methyltransferase
VSAARGEPAGPAAGARDPVAALLDAATEPYRAAGRFAWHFARGKLSRDPAFRGLLAHGLVRDGALVDIGCGQGLLAAWLLAARACHASDAWPAGWPPPPTLSSIAGIELMAVDVERARRALGERARFVAGDMRTVAVPPAETVVLLDVLHYVPIADQDDVLARVRDALAPNGALLLRVGDAAGGFGFRWSNWVDRSALLARGHGWNPLWCRSLDDWLTALRRLGFGAVESRPMSQGTAFANVLLVATRTSPRRH